jgi:hypothetical protein
LKWLTQKSVHPLSWSWRSLFTPRMTPVEMSCLQQLRRPLQLVFLHHILLQLSSIACDLLLLFDRGGRRLGRLRRCSGFDFDYQAASCELFEDPGLLEKFRSRSWCMWEFRSPTLSSARESLMPFRTKLPPSI